MNKVLRLTPEMQEEFEDWQANTDGCSCHLNPPCGDCIHNGNPLNLLNDDTDTNWEESDDTNLLTPREVAAHV